VQLKTKECAVTQFREHYTIFNAAALSVAKESLKENTHKLITTEKLLAQIEKTSPSISEEEIKEYEAIRKRMER